VCETTKGKFLIAKRKREGRTEEKRKEWNSGTRDTTEQKLSYTREHNV
jgi:hypothetical protein